MGVNNQPYLDIRTYVPHLTKSNSFPYHRFPRKLVLKQRHKVTFIHELLTGAFDLHCNMQVKNVVSEIRAQKFQIVSSLFLIHFFAAILYVPCSYVRVRFLRARVTLGLNSPRMRIKKGKKSMACCLGEYMFVF